MTTNNFAKAMSRFKRRKFDECIEICDELLAKNPRDQAAWILKCQSLTKKNYIDDIEIDEQNIGDMLLDEHAVTTFARPGTSFMRPQTNQRGSAYNPIQRPNSRLGRPTSGMHRTGSRAGTSQGGMRLSTAMRTATRGATSRVVTAGGRMARLGTASLIQRGDIFIEVDKLNLKKIAKKRQIAKPLFDYLFYVEKNFKKAIELAAEGTKIEEYEDWWWKERLGRSYYHTGMLRDAEKQLLSSIKIQPTINAYLLLAQIYVKLDQPSNTIEILKKAMKDFKYESEFHVSLGRVYEMLNESEKSFTHYKLALAKENNNMEAVACIANHFYYEDSPEVSLRFYQRLIELGINNAEIWNNMALCLFTNSQYDLFMPCVERALKNADETTYSDIWYNIAQIALGLGEPETVLRALRLSLSHDGTNAEALNNLGIVELKRGNVESALYNFRLSIKENPYLFEPHFNFAVNALKIGMYQDAYDTIKKGLEIYPEHKDSQKLLDKISGMLK